MKNEHLHNNKKTQRLLTVFIVISCISLLLSCTLLGIHLCEKSYLNNRTPLKVTMVQLIATPERYDGKKIRVIGVGNLEFEGNYLSLSKEEHAYRAGNSIWLDIDTSNPFPSDEAQKYNGKYVIVEGVFDKNNTGHMGLFCGAIKNISRYDVWRTDAETPQPIS